SLNQPALPRRSIEALVQGKDWRDAAGAGGLPADDTHQQRLSDLAHADQLLSRDHELDGILHALDGGYLRPAPGGDVMRNPEVLP
ncbi:MAG: cobaltochelatase subunit CobN, partial [Rubrivivax sp.]